jgi:hypothetical protein
MATEIEEDAFSVLEFAVKHQDAARAADVDQISEDVRGPAIQEGTGLSPERVNDAVALLRQNGFLDGLDFFGTAPFDFGQVHVTPFGRYEYQRARTDEGGEAEPSRAPSIDRLPVPVGSPFGFTDLDWEYVSREKGKSDQLKVALGYQFKSDYYESDLLVKNLTNHFQTALSTYNDQVRPDPRAQLIFKPLSAGFGEHLFNDIAREIIASDVAVFEASDLNPNVMIEMGVALTWGTRVLPIKEHGRPTPPSDVSGQTWADYRESATEFVDGEFQTKLVALIERAHRKKLAAGTPRTE